MGARGYCVLELPEHIDTGTLIHSIKLNSSFDTFINAKPKLASILALVFTND